MCMTELWSGRNETCYAHQVADSQGLLHHYRDDCTYDVKEAECQEMKLKVTPNGAMKKYWKKARASILANAKALLSD